MQYEAVVELCKKIKNETNKTVWLWSGYTLEYIKEHFSGILSYIDVLVDGPYIKGKSVPNLQWRGSTNQKVWKVESVNLIFDVTDNLEILQ